MYELYLKEVQPKLRGFAERIPQMGGQGYEEVLANAIGGANLDPEDVAVLLSCAPNEEKRQELVKAATGIKERYYGNTLKKIIPLSISNYCVNDCAYCGYRKGSKIIRKRLPIEEFKKEFDFVFNKGYRHIELVISEDPLLKPELLSEYVEYAVQRIGESGTGGITFNIAPLDTEGYRKLKDAGLYGLYMWQESYDPHVYREFHPSGTPKGDFVNRLTAYERMIEAGIRSYGVGVLFGLGDPFFEVLNIIEHCNFLEREYGYMPSMFGIPRLQRAIDSSINVPPYPVSDGLLKTIVAIYRLSFPATNIFVNSRETFTFQLELAEGGGDVIVFECSTYPGGYSKPVTCRQFEHYYVSAQRIPILESRGYSIVDSYDNNWEPVLRDLLGVKV